MKTDREKAFEILDKIRGMNYSDKKILNHLIFNYLSGFEALGALEDFEEEFIEEEFIEEENG